MTSLHNCLFEKLEAGTACVNCGYQLKKTYSETPRRNCRGPETVKAGDALEELLTSYGITKEWYQGFKKEHGLPPICNCEARQEWLNKVSAAHPQIANIGVKILNALKRK